VETAVNAAVAVSYSALIRVTGGINATAQCHAAGRPAKSRAKPAGSQHRTTKTTSKDRRTSHGCASGGRATPGIGAGPIQDHSLAQPIDFSGEVDDLTRPALQDVLAEQPAVLIGLIAHLVGTPLQDSIVRTTDRLLRLGQDILATAATGEGRQRPEPRTRSPPEP
jgi:hypothetical protein